MEYCGHYIINESGIEVHFGLLVKKKSQLFRNLKKFFFCFSAISLSSFEQSWNQTVEIVCSSQFPRPEVRLSHLRTVELSSSQIFVLFITFCHTYAIEIQKDIYVHIRLILSQFLSRCTVINYFSIISLLILFLLV